MSTIQISAATNTSPIQITTTPSHGFINGQTVSISKCDPNLDANGIWTIGGVTSTTFTLTGSVGTHTVTNATNTSPIVITLSTTHNYVSGQSITVSGVLGNTAANGTRTISVINSTSFSLVGTTGNAAYVSGGSVISGVYVGTGSNLGIASSNSIGITSATNATPIVITTSFAHSFVGGQTVTITGVLGNTAANGTYSIRIINTTQFSLFSTTSSLTSGRTAISGNGTYTSGGFATILGLASNINIIDDLHNDKIFGNNSNYGIFSISIITIDQSKYDGPQGNFGSSNLQNFATIFDASKYNGNQANFGEIVLDDGNNFSDVDYDATSLYPKTQITYYKLRGFNPNTGTFETWITQEDIVKRPELYTPKTNPPNYFNGIFYTPPSGNSLQDIVIIGKWVENRS